MTTVPDPARVSVGLREAAHVGIAVSDLDRSVAFYQALLGVEPVVRDETMQGPGSRGRRACRRRGSGTPRST